MDGHIWRARVTLALLGAVITAQIAAAIPASAALSCWYDATTRTVSASITGSQGARLKRAGDSITLEGIACASGRVVATRFNTDTITIRGEVGTTQYLIVDLTAGAFAPGRSDEPGSSDEIEINVDLRSPSSLGGQVVYVLGSGTDDQFRVGRGDDGRIRINLNAAEADGIDADLTTTRYGIDVRGGAGKDLISAAGGAGTGVGVDTPGWLEFRGDDGDDTLRSGTGGAVLFGGAGSDFLVGSSGHDQLIGGPGRDYEMGGAGDDHFDQGATPDGADVLDGGAGRDWLFYNRRTAGVRVTLDASADDGDAATSEHDRVGGDIDDITAGHGNDVLVGNGAANRFDGGDGSDQLFGGGGDDSLHGRAGNDRISGDAGHDGIFGYDGSDQLLARDGVSDEVGGGAGADSCSYDWWIDDVSSC